MGLERRGSVKNEKIHDNFHGKNQNNYSNIPEEELKKLKAAVEKKRKSYNSPQDIMTVFAIFAMLALTCVVIALIGGNPDVMIGSSSGTITPKKHEEAKQISYVITGITGVVSLAVICLFIRSIRKRKKKEAREFELRELKRLELEAARRRVENARRGKNFTSETSEWEKRRAMRKYSLDEEFEDEGLEEKYNKYFGDEADYDIDKLLSEYGIHEEEYGFIEKIKRFFRNHFKNPFRK